MVELFCVCGAVPLYISKGGGMHITQYLIDNGLYKIKPAENKEKIIYDKLKKSGMTQIQIHDLIKCGKAKLVGKKVIVKLN